MKRVSAGKPTAGRTRMHVMATQNCRDALNVIAHILPLTPACEREGVLKPRRVL